jgi:hypothetical protein
VDTDKYVEILGEQIDKLGCQISDVKDEVQLMKEVLNNGIVSATYENTETIKELATKIDNVENKVKVDESYSEGKIKTWKIVLATLILGGNFLLGLVTAASYIGII